MSAHAPVPGRLLLVPNTLDHDPKGQLPVGELGDVLPMRVLHQAARLTHWVSENARSTRAFLKRVDAAVPLQQPLQAIQIQELPRPPKGSQRQQPADPRLWEALLEPLRQGHDVGLMSEAGLPAVADPGALLVAAAHAAGFMVEPMSGPSSLLMALSASGLDGQHFAFVGYLPVDAAPRAARIRELEQVSRRQGQTQIAIEAPYRNAALHAALVETLDGASWLSISCGLTLPSAWTRTARVSRWRQREQALPAPPNDTPAVFVWRAG